MVVNEESLKHLKTLEDNTFDSCVTDPPYHLASILKRFGPGQKGINNKDEKEGRNGPYHRAAKGFMGQTTAYNKDLIKSDVVIMGENTQLNEAKYIIFDHLYNMNVQNRDLNVLSKLLFLR